MKEVIVSKNDAGQRLDRFLCKAFPLMSQGFICKAVRKKRIKVGGKRTETNYKLCENDSIQLYINDEFLEEKKAASDDDFLTVPTELDIVYEDENILLADKKPGMVVHEDNDNTVDTLINRIKHYLYDKGEYNPKDEQSFVPSLCNRIDRNTGGIVIAAKNAESLRILNQKIRDRELVKLYLCIVEGEPPKKADTMTAYLEKRADENTVIVSDRKTATNRTIKTKYRVVDSCGGFSLVEVDLLTGRTHQIRAHFAYIGHPLLGDGKYGHNKVSKEWGYKYQALYSYKLRFSFTTDGGILSYLDGREFAVNEVWFKDKYYSDKLIYLNKQKEGH